VGCPLHEAGTQSRTFNNQRRSTPASTARTAIKNIRIFDGQSFSQPKIVCIDVDGLLI
jgi:hypothetical protein